MASSEDNGNAIKSHVSEMRKSYSDYMVCTHCGMTTGNWCEASFGACIGVNEHGGRSFICNWCEHRFRSCPQCLVRGASSRWTCVKCGKKGAGIPCGKCVVGYFCSEECKQEGLEEHREWSPKNLDGIKAGHLAYMRKKAHQGFLGSGGMNLQD